MNGSALVRRAQPWLGTIVEIAVPAKSIQAVDAGFAAIRHVHERMSFHNETSDLARLRSSAAGQIVAVDPLTVEVLEIASRLREATGGLFDITIGRTLVRDDFLPDVSTDPLSLFDGKATDIVLLDAHRVRCDRRVLIDLGGIAKGFAVDRAVEALAAAGVPAGIVNAGGDARVFGSVDHVVHIRSGDGSLNRALSIREGAIASSSNVRSRYWNGTSTRTPHIRPDGEPVVIDSVVSVVANSAVMADAMTKVAMIDPDRANRLLAEHGGAVVSAMFERVAA